MVGETCYVVVRIVRTKLVEQQEGIEVIEFRSSDDTCHPHAGTVCCGHTGQHSRNFTNPCMCHPGRIAWHNLVARVATEFSDLDVAPGRIANGGGFRYLIANRYGF
jgi:hypothetical protein